MKTKYYLTMIFGCCVCLWDEIFCCFILYSQYVIDWWYALCLEYNANDYIISVINLLFYFLKIHIIRDTSRLWIWIGCRCLIFNLLTFFTFTLKKIHLKNYFVICYSILYIARYLGMRDTQSQLTSFQYRYRQELEFFFSWRLYYDDDGHWGYIDWKLLCMKVNDNKTDI